MIFDYRVTKVKEEENVVTRLFSLNNNYYKIVTKTRFEEIGFQTKLKQLKKKCLNENFVFYCIFFLNIITTTTNFSYILIVY